MFRQIRYQTGEIDEIISEMRNGNIPCMDIDNHEELNWFLNLLTDHGIFQVKEIPYDKNARDRVKEPEFEFRIAFTDAPDFLREKRIMYIDIYFEPDIDRTYDTIFGD